jgi:tRNA threonylcarbamoyladenosine biosynthesis protein TsaE
MTELKNIQVKDLQKQAQKLALKVVKNGGRIGLIGNLGAGKTTFAKSFAKALGISKVKSPTFTLIHQYPLKDRLLYHIDLYRLNHLDDLQALGLSELLRTDKNIVLIEWVDKFKRIEKLCDYVIKFEIVNHKLRNVKILEA